MAVDALDLPPCLARYDLYAFSTGYLDVPVSREGDRVMWFRRNATTAVGSITIISFLPLH